MIIIPSVAQPPQIGCVRANLSYGQFSNSFNDRRSHVRVQVSPATSLRYGNCYRLTNVEPIVNDSYNYSSFDYQKYMKSKSIFYEADGLELLTSRNSLVIRLKNIREHLIEQNNQRLGGLAAYVNAILLGENKIDSYYKVVYGQVGIAPLFAISGMHIGMIYAVLLYYFSKFRVIDTTANKIIIVILIIYSVLAGSSVAINRALMMIGLKTIFNLKTKRTIMISSAISLIYNPFNLLNQGYYLSYIITYAIVAIPRSLYYEQKFSALKFGYLLYLISVPLSYSFNYTYNLLAPIGLLIVTPIVSFGVMPLSLILTLAPNRLTAALLQALVGLINQIAEFLNMFTVTSGHVSWLMWLIYIVSLYLLFGRKQLKVAMIIVSVWFVAIGLDIDLYPQITFIDVGQGDGALVEYKGLNLLFDVGNKPTEIRQELKYQGVSDVDALFISHAHLDHYGAVPELTKYIDIEQIYEVAGNQIITNSTGLRDFYQNDWITVIPYYGSNDNDRELIVRIDFGQTSVLFPGDIERESEDYLVANYCREINSDIIKVPHHGSKTSSSQSFLNCVSPDVAVISSGRNNRYGHPSSEVVERYQPITELYDTQFDGEVTIKVKADQLDIRKVRQGSSP